MKSAVKVAVHLFVLSCQLNVMAHDKVTQSHYCLPGNSSGALCNKSLPDHLHEKAEVELKQVIQNISLLRPVDIETICNISTEIISKISLAMAPFSTDCPTNQTTPFFTIQPNTYFISLQLLAESAISVRKDDCEINKGMYNQRLGVCILNSGNNSCTELSCILKYLDPHISNCIAINGCVFSSVCLVILLITYCSFKELQTLPGKNLIRMSVVLLLAFVIQLVISGVKNVNSVCAVSAILLHWAYLTSFAWMTAISLDLLLTFNFPGRLSSDTKNRRFSLYNYVSFGMPTVLVLLCVLLEYAGKNFIGYGVGGVCFVANVWANLFAFTVPIGILLLFNTICLFCTIRKIYVTHKRIQ